MSRTALRVLFLALEFPQWKEARHVSYAAQLGMEEGLRELGVDCFTITTPWFSEARALCAGRRFDQVWIEVARHDVLENPWLEWMASLAPVRLGLLAESLEYGSEETAIFPELAARNDATRRRLRYVTHVAACDEHDAANLKASRIPAMWWPQAVPLRYLRSCTAHLPGQKALFAGAVYPPRNQWLELPMLRERMTRLPGPIEGSQHAPLFDALHSIARLLLRVPRQGDDMLRRLYCHFVRTARGALGTLALEEYLFLLRSLREHAFRKWINAIGAGMAVVNLPHFVKTYSGRVVEGMAAGRPVISWRIPNRPLNEALFEDQREILLFDPDRPESLVAQMDRLTREPNEALRIAERAQQKVAAHHTVETRIRQILKWLETAEEPRF